MAIPDYESIMLPLLQFAGDGEEHSLREAYDKLADYYNLSQDERKELLPSGQQEVFHNRVGWWAHISQKGMSFGKHTPGLPSNYRTWLRGSWAET